MQARSGDGKSNKQRVGERKLKNQNASNGAIYVGGCRKASWFLDGMEIMEG